MLDEMHCHLSKVIDNVYSFYRCSTLYFPRLANISPMPGTRFLIREIYNHHPKFPPEIIQSAPTLPTPPPTYH